MTYHELDLHWQKIFEMEWNSLCEGSKAIAALIISDTGEIISEGRNKIGTVQIPNPRVLHAEVEAVRNLDIQKHPFLHQYTLVTALEPCPMCMGTLIMGGIRHVIIGAKDDYGGAMDLINHSAFLKSKNVEVLWMDQIYGDIQRALQTIRELLFYNDTESLNEKLRDFSVYNRKGVQAAEKLIENGIFRDKAPADYRIDEIFDQLAALIE